MTDRAMPIRHVKETHVLAAMLDVAVIAVGRLNVSVSIEQLVFVVNMPGVTRLAVCIRRVGP